MEIMSVGFTIPGYSEEAVSLNSRRAISDVDLVLISTEVDKYSYTTMTYSNGDESFDINGSRRLDDDLNHWHKSIYDHVSAGDVVFLMLKSIQRLSLATGVTSTKGKVTTYETKIRKNDEIIPVSLKGVSNLHGKKVVLDNSISKCFQFPGSIAKYVNYEVSFKQSDDFHPVYWTKNKTGIIGGYKQIAKGYVVLLPSINYDEEKFTTTDKEGGYIWTKDALEFGESLVDFLSDIKKNLLSGINITPPPAWSNDIKYQTEAEIDANDKINKNREKIKKLKEDNEKLQDIVNQESVLKGLLYETGKPLEDSVTEALKLLGYNAENYDDGTLELDQVITSPEGNRLIGECEGKDNKMINVTKFRQLSDSLSADFERDDVNEKAKGVLFGNPFRLTEPRDRNEWFTKKAIFGAEREKVSLVKTSDLYVIAKHIKDKKADDKFISDCRKAIYEQSGIVKFPEIPAVKINRDRSGIDD